MMCRLTAMGVSDVAEVSESEMENGNEEAGETNHGWEKVKSRKEKKGEEELVVVIVQMVNLWSRVRKILE